MNIRQIITTLTDPENQPHQYVDRENELLKDFFGLNEIKEYEVNNMCHGEDLKRSMAVEGWTEIGGVAGTWEGVPAIMVFTRPRQPRLPLLDRPEYQKLTQRNAL